MRATDQITAEYIQSLETDNDHLRAELEAIKGEYEAMKVRLQNAIKNPDDCL